MPTAPVAYSIAELLIMDVVETLAEISTHSGYLNDLQVEVKKQGGNPPIRDGLVIVDAGDPKPLPTDQNPLGFHRFLMTVGVCGYLTESESSDPRVLRGRLSSVAADIRRALSEDLHRGRYAKANYTDFPDPDEFDIQGGMVIVWPRICFDTLFNNPYEQ